MLPTGDEFSLKTRLFGGLSNAEIGLGWENCRSLGFPGFPGGNCGFGQLHVVLFRENHINGRR
jgi:hypothetical protein